MDVEGKLENLMDPEDIARQLDGLRDGYASAEIEGNPLTADEKRFLDDLVREGTPDDEAVIEIKKYCRVYDQCHLRSF